MINNRLKKLIIIFVCFLCMQGVGLNTTKAMKISSIKDCIEIALKNSPVIGEKEINLKLQDREKNIAKSFFFPHINAKGSYTRSKYPQRVIPAQQNNQPGIYDKDQFLGTIELTFPIFLGGKRFYVYKISTLSKDIASLLKFMTKQDLIYNIANTYLKITETNKAIDASSANIKLLSKQLEDINLKIKIGKSPEIDKFKVEVSLLKERARKNRYIEDQKILYEILKKLIGIDEDIHIEYNIPIDVKLSIDLIYDKLVQFAKDNRPEYIGLKKELEVAKLNIKKEKSTRLPQISLNTSYNIKSGSPYSRDSKGGAIDHQDYWLATINFQLPIFYGGEIQNTIEKSKLNVLIIRQKLKDFELEIKKQITEAISKINSFKYDLNTAEKNKKLAKEVLRIEKLKYQKGKNTINDVLDAHALWIQAEFDYIHYLYEYNLAKLKLYKVIGFDLYKIIKDM